MVDQKRRIKAGTAKNRCHTISERSLTITDPDVPGIRHRNSICTGSFCISLCIVCLLSMLVLSAYRYEGVYGKSVHISLCFVCVLVLWTLFPYGICVGVAHISLCIVWALST